jgi:hypothetical protein
MSAFKKQVGGIHYKNHKIQPYEFIQENNLNYLQGVVIKYIVRYPQKNGIQDLEKIIHYCQLEIERLKNGNGKN